jgi:tetratricopeptide (TPR) repeat protein
MIPSLPLIGGAVVSLLMAAGPAQLPVSQASVSELELVVGYRQVIEKYRRGDTGAVDEAIAIAQSDLQTILRVIFAVPEMPWASEVELRAAAMLHADAALRRAGLNKDDTEEIERHLSVARRMLHASSSRDGPFISRWYYTVSRALRDRQLIGVAENLLERGRAQAPGDPVILYESATVAEARARGYSVKVTETVSGIPSIEPDTARNQQWRAGLLNDAARWLREALAPQRAQDARWGPPLEREGAMLIARLHLGRVETLRGHEKDGLVQLELVFKAATDDATAYLAALFSGAAHERMRRPDAAEASYRQAIDRFPSGQAAYVALSEGLQRSGRTDDSRRVLHSLLDGKAGPIREPWWWYLAELPGVADERLVELRREVRP